MTQNSHSHAGLVYAVSAFVLWGLVPIYFKAIASVDPLEILSHRILWSVVFLFLFLLLSKQWSSLKTLSLKQCRPYFLSALLVSCNWFIFIWAVAQERILETSLGYFINPLVSVVLGIIFLKERLRPWQSIAVGMALLGVINQIYFVGELPWIAISLALSFACYGLVRKVHPISALKGLFIETCVMLPFALAYLIWLAAKGNLSFSQESLSLDALLLLAGLVTSLPLLLFAAGTQRLSLNVMGMVQYITPTLSFLLAVYLYHEPFSQSQLWTFVWIWLGLIVFSLESVWQQKKSRQTTPTAGVKA